MRTTLLLCLALLAATPLAAAEVPALPDGRVTVDVMTFATTPRAAELNAKLQAEVQRNPEQWLADAKQTNPEDRLAWNERLGLTKEEHAELQRLSGELRLAKTGEASVAFVHDTDRRVTLHPDASLPGLAGIVLDLDHDVVETPFGNATERVDVASAEWTGVQWKLEAPGEDPGTGTTVQFTIARLAEDGRVLLEYEAKQVESGRAPRRASCVVVLPFTR